MTPEKWHPWTVLLPSPIITNVATLGKLGYLGKAPGTNGSVAGVLLYTVMFYPLEPFFYFLILAAWIYLAIAFCGEAENRLFKRDPGEVILDEVVAMPVCFIGLQGAIAAFGAWAWTILLLGFGLFRLFDILKPFGIKKLQDLPGGLGVVVDDLAAGVATCICLHFAVYFAAPYIV
ncbi:phosphatidylglycerophosphatase A family protein [Cerasicoccus arenae]|uniref:Phosphatidylglycerophosphatase A n=1 Tax=Cerasicoccus arenae TaxID=424488 RepID=A0A8J3D948_9BACT|nr:phosphatidylglycerophosphatase A [Cerasicoccus arenae]MBK1857076.1 phosphatidylglycerophosphatase A [Cerasicoccus arenae]GHB92229.1 phosphatidylglycerophosphatase A [Cerasicoccus arenae]